MARITIPATVAATTPTGRPITQETPREFPDGSVRYVQVPVQISAKAILGSLLETPAFVDGNSGALAIELSVRAVQWMRALPDEGGTEVDVDADVLAGLRRAFDKWNPNPQVAHLLAPYVAMFRDEPAAEKPAAKPEPKKATIRRKK